MYVIVWKKLPDDKPFWTGDGRVSGGWTSKIEGAAMYEGPKTPGIYDPYLHLFVTVEEALDLVTLASL